MRPRPVTPTRRCGRGGTYPEQVIRFAKGHGTQNDFVVLGDLDAALTLTPAVVSAVCDRRRGLGADGVLRVTTAGAALAAGVFDRVPDGVSADKAKAIEIWRRFPKFILGFVATFAVALALALGTQAGASGKLAAAIGEANVLRVIFFTLTFFSIGVMSNFRKLWEDGLGKLAAVYFVSLFGFVIWVGFVVSWLFFAGVKPPLAS